MSVISPDMVKDLREKTGVGMMECKKALTEANGDFAAAEKILRERGIAKAGARTERVAAEGLAALAISADKKHGVVVELNSETDFVARNEEFGALVASIARAGLGSSATSLDQLLAVGLPSGKSVRDAVSDIQTKIGEKIELSSYERVDGDLVAGYLHPPGKIGVLVAGSVDGIKDLAAAEETLREVAMHVAAAAPRFLSEAQVDAKTMEAEKEIYANLARNEGKPEAIIPKIVEGKVKSFYRDYVLVDQMYVKDDKQSVGQVVAAAGKKAGGTLALKAYARVKVGGKAAAK